MKIVFNPASHAPEKYEFDGERITAHYQGKSETFDLSGLEEGDKFYVMEEDEKGEPFRKHGVEPEVLDLPGTKVIRDAVRRNGELHVYLKQEKPIRSGHWKYSDWIDAKDYDPDKLYIKKEG